MADRNGYIGRSPGDSAVVIARQSFSPTGIQTNFTFSSGYTVGYIDLYLNGARLVEGQDFTATDGSVVGLTTNAVDGDVLELVAYKAFNATNVSAATGDFSVGGNLSVTGNTELTGTLTVGGVEVQPGAAGTWASYDTNTGISTTKKVKVDNDFEVTGVGTFASRVSIGDSIFHVGDDNTAFGFPAADTFTVYTAGSEALRVTGIGSVGIGENDPSTRLHVTEASPAEGILASFENSVNNSGEEAGIRFIQNDTSQLTCDVLTRRQGLNAGLDLIIRQSNSSGTISTTVVITETGNVGVGTVTPTTKLHVLDTTKTSTTARDNIVARFVANASNADCNIQLSNGIDHSALLGIVGNGAEFYIAQDGVERLRIDSSGRVGIGTDSISSLLQVRTASAGANMFMLEADLGTNNNRTLSVTSPATDSTTDPFVVNTGNSLSFQVDSNLGLHIHSDGKIGVGTVGPTHSLHVYDTTDNSAQRNDVQAYTGGITIQNQSEVFDAFAALRFNFHGDDSYYLKARRINNNNGEFEIGQNYSSTNTDNIAIKINNSLNVGIGSTQPTAKLDVGGDVLVSGIGTATQWDATSDIALKENIEIIDNPIVKLSELKGVTFDWKKGGHSVGVIAQDVEKVLPTAVGGSKDHKTVNYNAIIGLLVESVKDQQKQIEELKSLLDK